MTRSQPADLAAALERSARLPDGPGDRFAGYAVLGVPFCSGDVLALRRFPASSIGMGYTSVWHRDPDGRWTFYGDVPPAQGCTRYFGPCVSGTVVAPIRIEWTGPRSLDVAVDGGRLLAWSLCLSPTLATHLLNAVSAALPAGCWTSERGLLALAGLARLALRTGRLRLTGRTPAGNRFLANPRLIWTVSASRATIAGRKLGHIRPLPSQVSLGDFWIPRRPLFAVGGAFLLPPPADSPVYEWSPEPGG